jgi:hypothetical protein
VGVPLRVTADGAPLDERQVTIAARTRARITVPLPLDARHIEVRLLGHDSLALDDSVEATAPGGPPRDVLLLGSASDGLRRAIESLPTLRPRTADSPTPHDLTVLAGTLPPQLPPGPLLLVDPPANSARLLGVGLGSAARVMSTHPLLQGVDLAAFDHERPSVGGVPGWARVVLGTLDGPLLMEGRLEGHPVVAMTFDPAISGLEKSLAFPLLLSNATSFLLAQTEPAAARPPSQPPREAFDAAESDIAPRPVPTFAASSTLAAPGPAPAADAWPLLLSAVLIVLAAEWLVFARRG